MISAHQIRIVDFVSQADRWVTSEEIADGADVARRTARAEVFPGHHYRLAARPACNHLARITAARQALNLPRN